MPIMVTISSALEDENELARLAKKDKDKLVEDHKGQKASGPHSLLHGPKGGKNAETFKRL